MSARSARHSASSIVSVGEAAEDEPAADEAVVVPVEVGDGLLDEAEAEEREATAADDVNVFFAPGEADADELEPTADDEDEEEEEEEAVEDDTADGDDEFPDTSCSARSANTAASLNSASACKFLASSISLAPNSFLSATDNPATPFPCPFPFPFPFPTTFSSQLLSTCSFLLFNSSCLCFVFSATTSGRCSHISLCFSRSALEGLALHPCTLNGQSTAIASTNLWIGTFGTHREISIRALHPGHDVLARAQPPRQASQKRP
jgi:hypothetical protein